MLRGPDEESGQAPHKRPSQRIATGVEEWNPRVRDRLSRDCLAVRSCLTMCDWHLIRHSRTSRARTTPRPSAPVVARSDRSRMVDTGGTRVRTSPNGWITRWCMCRGTTQWRIATGQGAGSRRRPSGRRRPAVDPNRRAFHRVMTSRRTRAIGATCGRGRSPPRTRATTATSGLRRWTPTRRTDSDSSHVWERVGVVCRLVESCVASPDEPRGQD
jgi:hypothetical protein